MTSRAQLLPCPSMQPVIASQQQPLQRDELVFESQVGAAQAVKDTVLQAQQISDWLGTAVPTCQP